MITHPSPPPLSGITGYVISTKQKEKHMHEEDPVPDMAVMYEDGTVSRTRTGGRKGSEFADYIIASGTVSYAHIVKVFGLPTTNGDDYKIDAMWVIETPVGIAMLHNLKNGQAFNGPTGTRTVDITDWNIRACDPETVQWVEDALS
jgi:hypothetical protein